MSDIKAELEKLECVEYFLVEGDYIKGWQLWNGYKYPDKYEQFSNNQLPTPEMNQTLSDDNKLLKYRLVNNAVVEEPQTPTADQILDLKKVELSNHINELLYMISDGTITSFAEFKTEIDKILNG
jgi:hypothetical protein